MLPDRVSNPGPLTYESGALPIALRGPENKEVPLCLSQTWGFLVSFVSVYWAYSVQKNIQILCGNMARL